MKAAVWYGKKDIRVEDRDVPKVGEEQVKIKVAWTGICGSDLHEYNAGASLIPENEPDPITGVKAPLTMGHEFSGVVEEVGSKVKNVQKGDRVAVNPLITRGDSDNPLVDMYNGFGFVGLTADGGFADHVVVDEKHAVKLPDGMSLEHAALVEPTAVAVQAIRESGMVFGDSVAVFGAGPIGLLTIIAAKAAGAKEIFAFDLSETRLEKAQEVGATHAVNSGEKDPVEYIHALYPEGVDAAFEVAGVEPTFNQAIDVTKPRGVMTIVALYEKPLQFEPMKLTASGVRLASSLAYEPDVFEYTITLMGTGQLDPSPVITDHIELKNIVSDGFETLLNDKSQSKILVKLSGEK
ncbi:(R,R)-butanediol dehydrogenase [Lentibacillus sp. JNUCC-1]|uniref:2,3-butanediol dehydrogenase n=1 Tax=Lentibacillus sp. JNUCC-1 TaxID=2654513 RepID=UPI0012E7CF58|nr:2,3-butanediol dehydrogenase [Lentibacillus sp. JNUCC-1]MUV37640.1 (R,R)-butanediol dehydrogenase [Lentibacillus sp. JNUCC-1]